MVDRGMMVKLLTAVLAIAAMLAALAALAMGKHFDCDASKGLRATKPFQGAVSFLNRHTCMHYAPYTECDAHKDTHTVSARYQLGESCACPSKACP